MSAYTGTPPTVTAPPNPTIVAVHHVGAAASRAAQPLQHALATTGIDGGAFLAAVLVGLFVILVGLYLIRKATS